MSHKTKAYTRKQLHRAALRRRREAAADTREERAAQRQHERWLRKVEAAFKGCEVTE